MDSQVSKEDAVENLFRGVERAHRAEDVDAYLSFFDPDSVWVTGRGVCYRGRDALGGYLRGAIPGGHRSTPNGPACWPGRTVRTVE